MQYILFMWSAGLTKLMPCFRVLEAWCHCDFRKMEARSLKVRKFGRTYMYLTGIALDQDIKSLIIDNVQVCRSSMRRDKNNFCALCSNHLMFILLCTTKSESLKKSFKTKSKQTEKMSLQKRRRCLWLLSSQLSPLYYSKLRICMRELL